MDADLKQIVQNLQALANELTTEGRLGAATVAWSGVIGIHWQDSKLNPPAPPATEEAVMDEANESPEKKNATP